MKYILVTDFDNHWDKIPKGFTSYPTNMVKHKKPSEKYISGTETIFIKKFKYSNEVEKTWTGNVQSIEKLPGKIFFQVEIKKVIECPKNYCHLENGWYFER